MEEVPFWGGGGGGGGWGIARLIQEMTCLSVQRGSKIRPAEIESEGDLTLV